MLCKNLEFDILTISDPRRDAISQARMVLLAKFDYETKLSLEMNVFNSEMLILGS